MVGKSGNAFEGTPEFGSLQREERSKAERQLSEEGLLLRGP